MQSRTEFSSARRIVVKIGSALLTQGGQGLDTRAMTQWVEQMAQVRQQGIEVVLVSSGSVAEGMCRLGWKNRPKTLHELQAAASVGQMGLVQAYETRFQTHGLHTAQLLLTHEDIANRRRYLNAKNTLLTLLTLAVVPIINENDTVATDEIRFGDNDTLGALVANLVYADLLIILTDQPGLFERDPGLDPSARLISEMETAHPDLLGMAGGSRSGLGRGGMQTKVQAARLAARSGAATLIASGSEASILTRLMAGESLGTFLKPGTEPLAARKRWLAGHLQAKGYLHLDTGAVRALKQAGKSLLAIGVKQVEGSFQSGELVICLNGHGEEIARGLTNYSADEARRIQGQTSDKTETILGYIGEPELIHRDNLVLT